MSTTTATAEQPAGDKPTPAPLWMTTDVKIPFLGVCGEVNSGKTLFLLEVAPPPWRAIYFGLEQSATTYSSLSGITKVIEIPEVVGKDKPDYSHRDLWAWWEKTALALPRGEYDAILIDTIGDLQDGLTEFVASEFAKYGYSSEEKFRASKGLFWGKVKAHLASVLNKVIANTGVQTIAFAAHMKEEWKGGSSTGNRIPEGLDVWLKLATLQVELSRKPYMEKDKLVVPEIPTGKVTKGRLAIPVRDDKGNVVRDEYGAATWKTVNPPAIKACTPARIRRYIKEPPNWAKLKKEEQLEPEVMSPEEKLRIEAQIAENRRVAAEAELAAQESSTERLARAAALQRQGMAVARASVELAESAANSAEAEAKRPQPSAVTAEPAPSEDPRAVLNRTLMDQKVQAGLSDEQWLKVLAKRNAGSVEELTDEQAEELRKSLWSVLTKKDMSTDSAKAQMAAAKN